MPPRNKGKGKGFAWIMAHKDHAGDDCLIWPYGRNNETGYGSFGHLGVLYYAHRFMCELIHGPAPSDKHYATHSCGNGHGGCANPRHLAWDTASGNADDRIFHGRGNVPGQSHAKLTQELADQIRALKGKQSQYAIARDFNISRENVARIHRGIAWTGKPRRGDIRYNAEQRAGIALRARQMHKEGKSYDDIAAAFDISRTYASGLARGLFK